MTLTDPFPSELPDSRRRIPRSAFQRDLRTPYLHEFNVTLQRQFGPTRVAEVAYVGSRGRNLIASRDINQPRPSTAPLNLRPDPRFADITLIESRARSEFDSLQARFQQRYAFGCTMLVAYTLGKSMDDASGFFTSAGDPNFPQDSANLDAEWGRSSFDVRHRFSVSFSYDLPFEFTISGIVAMQSGRPFTVALLPEVDNSNTGRSSLGFGANDRPNISGNTAANNPGPNQWFNTAAFSMPAFGTFGNAGRNILDGPGYQNVNLALLKRVSLRGPHEPAAAGRGVQSAEPDEFRSAGQLLRLADVRADSVSRSAAPHSVRRAVDVLRRSRSTGRLADLVLRRVCLDP